MIIHIIRHAEAVDRSPDISEAHRYLTSRGRKRFRKVAGTLRKAGIVPDAILTSPLVRAVQTADILAEKLRYKGELQLSQLLGPGFDPDALDKVLDAAPEAQEVALVGHEPDLGELTRTLFAVDGACSLKKGAVVTFERVAGEDDGAKFIQLVTGGGKIVTSRSKALKRLRCDNEGQ